MRIIEHNAQRMVIKRSGVFDRAFTTLGASIGFGFFLFALTLEGLAWPWILLGVCLTAGCLFFRLLSADVTLTLDRGEGTLQIDWSQLSGGKSRTARLDQITAVTVEGDMDAERLVFELVDGTPLPLAPYLYTGGDHPKVKDAITSWLAQSRDAGPHRLL